jgi:hypothetical protein
MYFRETGRLLFGRCKSLRIVSKGGLWCSRFWAGKILCTMCTKLTHVGLNIFVYSPFCPQDLRREPLDGFGCNLVNSYFLNSLQSVLTSMADDRSYEVGSTLAPLTLMYGSRFSKSAQLWYSNFLYNVKQRDGSMKQRNKIDSTWILSDDSLSPFRY